MKIKALILFLFLALWGVLFFLNPTLLSGSQTLLASLPSIKIPSSFYFAPTVVDAQEELKMYRGNRQRHGVSQEVLSLPLSKTVLATGVNESPYLAAKSSPVIDETGLYVGSDRGEFLAYNLDGSLKWKFAPLPAMTGIHGTALLGPDSVVFGSYNGRLYSLDKKEGRVQWSIELASPGSIGSSPLQDREGFLYVSVELPSPDGFIVKLDKVDGHVVWLSKNVGDHPHSSPVLDEEHRQVVFGSNNDRVSSFDLDSGQLKWVMQVRGAVKSTPLVWGDKIYVTDRGGFLSALDAGTGKVLWQQQLGSEGLHGSPVIVPELERVYS
ncbi:MAG: PQQ-binding-like beta-propeller repeat protein, partial [Bdellovibrio sp.]